MPSAVAFAWIARTALRIESSDVLGNVFESSRTKNEFSSAWCTSPSSASARKSSGTNDRSAKYAIIAARWVPRSAKNLLQDPLHFAPVCSDRMDATQAIADLTEISPQVKHVVVVGADGEPRRLEPAERGRRRAARRRRASGCSTPPRSLRPGRRRSSRPRPSSGSVFVVRDGGRLIAATTTPEPTVGLVFYDLKTCLRSIDLPRAEARDRTAPRRAAARRTEEDGDAAA